MLVKRAVRVQIPCHSKFQCSFLGLRMDVPVRRTILELTLTPLRQIGAKKREVNHMGPFAIDDIARRLLERVPPGLQAVRADLENNFRAVLRTSITKLDLVTRDEFDAQTRVLERTRARLEELERQVSAIERSALAGGVSGGKSASPASGGMDPAGSPSGG
jgi:BMFP domain-containing protein YqiC